MKWLLFVSILLSGLVAGLLYAYSCSVNNGLKSLQDSEYVRAMQSINAAIQNPLFFISFMGLLLVFPVTTWQLYKSGAPSLWLFTCAMLIYMAGVFGVTVLGNVPLNEQLAGFSAVTATEQQMAAVRAGFEKPWNSFHTIRTLAALLSFSLTIVFILVQKK